MRISDWSSDVCSSDLVKAGTQAREADAAQAVSIANRTAVIEWEKQVKARDPDYAIKHPMILDRIRAVVLSPGGKRPASPDEAVALAKRAYDDVTAYLTKIDRTSTRLNSSH